LGPIGHGDDLRLVIFGGSSTGPLEGVGEATVPAIVLGMLHPGHCRSAFGIDIETCVSAAVVRSDTFLTKRNLPDQKANQPISPKQNFLGRCDLLDGGVHPV